MKKILLLTTICSLFILSSCDNDPYIYDSDITSNTTTNIPEPTTEPEANTSKETTSSSGGISLDGDVPDDGEVWTKVA